MLPLSSSQTHILPPVTAAVMLRLQALHLNQAAACRSWLQLVAKITNCMEQGPSHMLTVPQLLKKSPEFYGKPKSKTAFTSARHLSPP